MSAAARIVVLTHRRAHDTRSAMGALLALAERRGIVLALPREELDKHGLSAGGAIELDDGSVEGVDLCLTLGGDGTILAALRRFAGTGVPTFGVNFGAVGFLATTGHDDLEQALGCALDGGFETLALPAIELIAPGAVADPVAGGQRLLAINDVSVQRTPGGRVADLAYGLGAQEVGRVRCDGLVVATPAGSTGYNLANGGPVLAWGVEGFVVSFIAPHSLTARALVAAPGDEVSVLNASHEEAVKVHLDGRPAAELAPGERIALTFSMGQGTLAQLPGATFYRRLRERFGQLAS